MPHHPIFGGKDLTAIRSRRPIVHRPHRNITCRSISHAIEPSRHLDGSGEPVHSVGRVHDSTSTYGGKQPPSIYHIKQVRRRHTLRAPRPGQRRDDTGRQRLHHLPARRRAANNELMNSESRWAPVQISAPTRNLIHDHAIHQQLQLRVPVSACGQGRHLAGRQFFDAGPVDQHGSLQSWPSRLHDTPRTPYEHHRAIPLCRRSESAGGAVDRRRHRPRRAGLRNRQRTIVQGPQQAARNPLQQIGRITQRARPHPRPLNRIGRSPGRLIPGGVPHPIRPSQPGQVVNRTGQSTIHPSRAI